MNPIKIENSDTMNVHAHLFTLQNEHLTIKISDYGATIVAILMKDRYGKTSDIVLGFDNLQGYLQDKGKISYRQQGRRPSLRTDSQVKYTKMENSP